MEAPNGDSRGAHPGQPPIPQPSSDSRAAEGYSSSSRRDDYYASSSSRHRDDHRSSSSRYEDDRYDRYRDRERERRHRDSADPSSSSHHRSSSHRDHGSSSGPRDYTSSSNRDGYGRGDYGSSSRTSDYPAPSSRDRESRYDSGRHSSSRYESSSSSRGGGGYGGYGNRDRKRSASPKRHQPRGPTPDLTNVLPIDQRKRRVTLWDVKPAGYENVTAEQAKMSGLFPLPGAPRNPQAMTPDQLRALQEGRAPAGPAGSSLAPLDVPKLWALNASHSRQARRLVVSKLPGASTAAEINEFFNSMVQRLNVYKDMSGDAVKDTKKALSGGIAMVEFAESVYATTILALEEDISFMGVSLELRRPRDYIVQTPDKDVPMSDTVSSTVPDSSEKIVIKGLPVYLSSEQGLELVEAFGAVQSWLLVRENDSSESKVSRHFQADEANSKGVAFAQFKDPSITPIALNSLNGMAINEEHTLAVSLACIGTPQNEKATDTPGGAMGMVTALASEHARPARSRVLVLLNMVTGDDLMDADEYDDILQDVQDECKKFGRVVDLQIPRPLGRSGEGPGVGKIFVRFETEEECEAALRGIAGRKFQERTVVSSYYPEVPLPPRLLLCVLML
jgi:splicing factor U2AF subunit